MTKMEDVVSGTPTTAAIVLFTTQDSDLSRTCQVVQLPLGMDIGAESTLYGEAQGYATEIILSINGVEFGIDSPGIPVAYTSEFTEVAVSFQHQSTPSPGAWTLTLQKRAVDSNAFSDVATFSVNT